MAESYYITLRKQVSTSKDVQWYDPNLDPKIISPALRELLVEYSGIPPADVEAHLHAIRDKAWDIFPFPCLGEWWFIVLGISLHPHYATLLKQLRDPAKAQVKFLDVGTCMGQDLRKLLFDGAPKGSLYGCDVLPEFENGGFEFFKDRETFQNHFLVADLFDTSSDAPLNKSAGTWDIINASMFLHQFDRDEALQACKRILTILSPKPGSKVMGVQVAMVEAVRMRLPPTLVLNGEESYMYQHSKETFRDMWEVAAREMNTQVKIDAEYGLRQELGETEIQGDERKRKLAAGANRRRLFFVIKRV